TALATIARGTSDRAKCFQVEPAPERQDVIWWPASKVRDRLACDFCNGSDSENLRLSIWSPLHPVKGDFERTWSEVRDAPRAAFRHWLANDRSAAELSHLIDNPPVPNRWW